MTSIASDAFGPGTLVEPAQLPARETLPLIVRAFGAKVELRTVLSENRRALLAGLDRHGAVLFRGFSLDGPSAFEAACERVSSPLMDYRDRATPRSVVGGRVLTATDYPPNVSICLHNENVFAAEFPRYLFFFCLRPAAEGGETPLADVRGVYDRIPVDVRDEFERLGVLYARTFGGRFGLDWRDVFQTGDSAEMERYCREAEIEWDWDGGKLRTRQRRPAVALHPQSGARVWLNHVATLHASSLEPGKRRMLLKMLGEHDLPNNVYYGDGAPIDDLVAATVRAAYDACAEPLIWEKGDLLIVDNLLVAHGRRPFRGGRELIVAMADPVRWSQVAYQGGATRQGTKDV